MVALTAVMMVGEIVAGYLTGSMALLADGFHMATHAGALSIAAAAYAFARRHANTRRFSFGKGKGGDLAGFASGMVLGLIALGIGMESALRLFQPITVAFGTATLIAVVGLAVNIGSAFLLSGGHHHGHGHDHHHGHDHGHAHAAYAGDNNLRSAYVHVLADALTSVLAIAALLAGRYLGWVWMDPVMGIVGAVVIARWSWTLMRDTKRLGVRSRSGYALPKVAAHRSAALRPLRAQASRRLQRHAGDVGRYHCRGALLNHGAWSCISFGSLRVDQAVGGEILRVLQPLGMQAAVDAIAAREMEAGAKRRQIELSLEQARFEATQARR